MIGCDTNLSPTGSSLASSESSSRVSNGDVLAHVRAESLDGIFALSKADPPKGLSGESLGSLAWWNDFSSQQMFLYSRLIQSPSDVNDALVNLERDLGVDSSDMISELSMVDRESNAANQPEGPTTWQPATYALALEIMGYDPADFDDSRKLPDPETCRAAKSAAYEASMKSLPSALKGILLASQAACGGGGCPCCNSTDPCCGSSDPCCGSSDRCCSGNDPCCNSPDSCCNVSDPCCGAPDPCCNADNPCCGNPDRCCGPSNPCCNSPDPCCNVNDPCCGDPDPCCNTDNPCCGNPDPCCGADPCDPICGDPCLCLICDDLDDCTADTCVSGACSFTNKCAANQLCCEGNCCPTVAPTPCCGPAPSQTCCGATCCWGTCYNDGTLCCEGKICPLPGGGEVCCDGCDECSATGCCSNAVTANGLCCGDGNPCTNDAAICEDPPLCTIYSCTHTPVCDDGDPCTYNGCDPDACNILPVCVFPPMPDCAECDDGNGYCLSTVCEPRLCDVGLSNVTGCPGGSITMDVTLKSCSPASTLCGDSLIWNVSESSPDISISGGGPIDCPSGTVMVNGTIGSDAAPTGPVPVTVDVTGLFFVGGPSCSYEGTVTIDECVNLTFEGVDDIDETTVGGFICFNDDDDNDNGVPDKDETGATAGENDLKSLTVSIKPNLTGTVTLDALAGGALVKLYENSDRSIPFSLPHTWTVPTIELPKTLYVEGFFTSAAAKDVTFKAEFAGDGGPCEDNVKVTVFSVQPVKVDATDPHAAQVNYHLDPHDILLESATFTAPGTSLTSTFLPTDFNFMFDQSDIITGDNSIRLVGSIGAAECDLEVITTLTHAVAPQGNVESEQAPFVLTTSDGTVPLAVTHTTFATFSFICYDLLTTPGSKTIHVGTVVSSISTPVEPILPSEIIGWIEIQRYNVNGADFLEGSMTLDTMNTLPPQGPHYRSARRTVDAFFAPGQSITVLSDIDTLFILGSEGSILAFSNPAIGNKEIDLELEPNSDPIVECTEN